ncbi:MAG: DUF3082 domain-containing protein [Cyanobacteria bacterium P01_A01_bin.17]
MRAKPMPESDASKPIDGQSATVHPLQCLTGAIVASIFALLLYRLTSAIATSFAAHPLSVNNQTAASLSVAVRTLVVGMSTLATSIFALAALGLLGLGLQLIWQRILAPKSSV